MKSTTLWIVIREKFPTYCLLIIVVLGLLMGCEGSSVSPGSKDNDSCNDLLTDEELLTEPDLNAVAVDSAYAAWIEQNNYPIRSLTSDCYSDLQFLKPLIGDRRLVQLGESGHGVAEFDAMKVRLIRFLHEEMGFDVIAFESSIFECFLAKRIPDTFSPEDMMRRSIFGVWHAQETLPLFEYITETQTSSRPLILAGFDIQISSARGMRSRPSFIRNVVANIDTTYAKTVYTIDSTLVMKYFQGWNAFQTFATDSGRTYMGHYNAMVSFFDANSDTLQTIYTSDPPVPLIARQTAWSMNRFIQMSMLFQPTQNYTSPAQTVSLRDRSMADNLGVLMDTIYPDKKIITWAHNYHIRHASRTMGELVAQRYRPELYTVGLYMYRGMAAENDRTPYVIWRPVERSLESVFYCTRRKYCFVDLLGQQQEPGNAWMFDWFYAKTWGQMEVLLKFQNSYDAILFIDTVQPPDYLD